MPSLGQTLATLTRRRPAAPPGGRRKSARMIRSDFTPNPGNLRMLTHVPTDLKPRSPLVVVLHGCTQTGEAYAEGAGWLTLADRFGFVVLCPEQMSANNPNLCFNWFQPADTTRGGGEVASIAAMVRSAVADHDIDPDRVFVTGLSAGGAMTAAMLATHPELFAGGAVIAGLPHGAAVGIGEAFAAMSRPKTLSAAGWGDKVRAASDHGGPWPPISIWHGQSDATVRADSGEALALQWLDVHGADAASVTARTPAGRDFEVWMSPAGEPVVELHRIPGMGHGTPVDPGGKDECGRSGPFLLDVGVASSLEIALGWGIAHARPIQGDQARKADALTTLNQTEAPRPGSEPLGIRPAAPDGVAEIIDKALRAAGLVR